MRSGCRAFRRRRHRMSANSGSDPPSSGRWRRLAQFLRAQDDGVELLEQPAIELARPLLRATPIGERPPSASLMQPGEQLGPYRILGELGHGASASVYLADDPRHERQVALKVLYPEVAESVGRQRFLQEIKLAARLQHPHILPVFDSGETQGRLWYAAPYVAGETLRHRLKREPRLPIAEAVRIAREVALALDYAHRQGVVHRDVKPANILLADGQALVADFGIARALRRGPQAATNTSDEELTETGLAIGTPAYMSPEQASGGVAVDGRSDLYSLGCVLYEMLAGRPPFIGSSAATLLHEHLTAEPPRVTDARPEVPSGIAAALHRTLAKTPEGRYATATEFAEALATGERQAGVVPPPTARGRWSRSRRAITVLLATVAFAGALAYLRITHARSSGGVVHPMASTIAVLPFVPVLPDTMLSRLGRELAVTLSANLDGVGGIRATEPLAVLGQVKGNEPVTPEAGSELARSLGARSLLQGTLVREGPKVRLDVELLVAENHASLARSTITGPVGDITALTDSTTLAVLKDIWRGGNMPAPSLAAITTHSVPALRAYLNGELAMSRADFDVAVRSFEQAFAADSTFWFAYWRSLYPRMYEGTPADSGTLAALLAHRRQLPEPDRLLLENSLTKKTMSEHLALLRQITSRFPTYWPGWWDYANYMVHWTPYIGTQSEDARAALERTVQLNPGFAPGWEHLLWIAGDQRDTAGAHRALHEIEKMSSTTAYRLNPELLNYYHVIYDLTADGGTMPPAEVEQQARYVAGYTGSLQPIEFAIGLMDPGFPRGEGQLATAVLRLAPPREMAAAMWAGLGFSYAGRGAWDSAVVAMGRWVRLTADSTAPLVRYGLAVTGVRLGFLKPAVAAGVRPRTVPTARAEEKAELAWLDGVLAHAEADPGALTRARREIRSSGSQYVDLLDGSLAAFQADLAGQRDRAARALAELEWESAERTAHNEYGRYHPFLNAVNRLTASPWLLAAGDTAQAARLLTWQEGIFWYGQHRFLTAVNKTVAPIALFELAQIEMALGETAHAAGLYREFLRRYDLATDEWARRVEQAKGALLARGDLETP